METPLLNQVRKKIVLLSNFVVPYDRVFYAWLSIILHILKLKRVLQCSYIFLYKRMVTP